MISVFGMQQSIVFYSGYLKSKGSFGELREIYFKMLILIGSISMIFLILNQVFIKEMKIDFFNENISELISKSIFALFFYSVAILNIETYRAISKLYLSEIFRSIGRYLFLLLAFYVLFKINKEPWIIEAFLLNFVLLSIMTSVPLIIWLMKIERIGTQKLITSKKIIFRSVPMALSSSSIILMQSVDVFLLSKYLDFRMVAFYSITFKLASLITLVLNSVNTVHAPKIAEFFTANKSLELKRTIITSTRLIFALTFPIILLTFIFSEPILLFFGRDYLIAKNAFLIIMIGQLVNVLCGSVGMYMNMTGKQKEFQYILLIALAINIFLNSLLIPQYGINGAAIATSISTVFWNVTCVIYIYRKDALKTYLLLNIKPKNYLG